MDSANVEAIITSIKNLIEQEEAKPETERGDMQPLKAALSALEAKEMSPLTLPPTQTGIVDTDVLTGPINGLKNFLIKKTRNQEAK